VEYIFSTLHMAAEPYYGLYLPSKEKWLMDDQPLWKYDDLAGEVDSFLF
jgi:hypothetical protein